MASNFDDTASRAAKASAVDSPYAWWRLVASMVMSSVGGVGLWSSVVLLTTTQKLRALLEQPGDITPPLQSRPEKFYDLMPGCVPL